MTRSAQGLAGAALVAVGLLASAPARAQATDAAPASDAGAGNAARAEARERFDKGLRLFNAGDNAGALVEFKRAYELVHNPIVLYNIGLVYAQMGRAVEATDALDAVLAGPAALSPERIALARRTRDEQASRIAEVALDANVAGARVEVDGIEVGATPLAAPLRVPGGTHVIGVVAAGFSPERKEIAIASGEKQALTFELVAMQGRLAHLAVRTHLPGADLFVDGQRVGATPLATAVSLAPGAHRVELRRAGYLTAAGDVSLADGASGELALEPEEDPAATSTAGWLALRTTESQPVVTIDGRTRGVYTGALRLAAGPHHLRVERADFVPAEREVAVDTGRTTEVHVTLEPTPEYRDRFVSRAQSQRTWGIVGAAAGAALAVGGAILLKYDADQRSDGNAALYKVLGEEGPGQICRPSQDTTTAAYQANCAGPFAAASSKVKDANTRDDLAWPALGVGAAAVVTGVILLVTADNPHKYDQPAPSSEVTRLRVLPASWGSGAAGIVVVGGF